jgi:hypothetical protein
MVINQHLPLQDPPRLNQIWIFGLKIFHLATLFVRRFRNISKTELPWSQSYERDLQRQR